MATYVISARPESTAWVDFAEDFESGRIVDLAGDATIDEAYTLIAIEDDDAAIFRALSEAFVVERAKEGLYVGRGGYIEVRDGRAFDVHAEVRRPKASEELTRWHGECEVAYCYHCRRAFRPAELSIVWDADAQPWAPCPGCGKVLDIAEHCHECLPRVIF